MWASKEQKRRIWVFVIGFLQIVSWVSASSRPFALLSDAHQRGQSPKSSPAPLDDKQDFKRVGGFVVNEDEEYKELSTLGSRPPNCEYKCGECSPCEAIQVPTTTNQFGVQYANYEPEGWKCKCGTSFFNP
ncbi:EPIDERMAL PATTERNING FACTOR-like protein 2 [Macadamia integrifolia]|uniref:EPIDERMAL PATTERNING FACTOR-like protein 2 n=1 Tax=Macadamia integrifolia TaxID=60698 RepID=UPI001C4F57CF|nr:EPIDERMAL PATTERNING FACTOR-like protein 2 [Macadamia integrifolia]